MRRLPSPGLDATRRWQARSAVLAVLILVAGCGSTVQVRGLVAGGGQLVQDGTTPGVGGAAANPGIPGQGSGQLSSTGGAVAGQVAGSVSGPSNVGLPSSTTVGPRGSSQAAVTGPVQLGFITTNVGNAGSLGVNAGQTFTDQQLYDALVKDVNAHGGLAGRQIIPVYGVTDTASSDWSTQFQAACSTFTQDHKVQAVLGYIFVWLDNFEQCLATANVPHFYGGYQPGDAQAQRDFPSVVSTAHPTVDILNLTVLQGAMQTGHLTKKTKLGIVIDTCAHGERAFARNTVPFLKAQGINYEVVQMSCAGGAGDAGSAAAAVKSAELQFSTHGVDTVYAPNDVEMLLFMENAESQAYHPQYLAGVGGAALEANAPAAQLANMHGFGWMPAVDVDPSHQPYGSNAAQQACLTMLRRQGLMPKAYNDFMEAYVTCDSLALYGKALTRTGGRTTPALIEQSVLAELPSFQGAATYEGSLMSSAGQRGGPGRWREYGWMTSCSCLTYRGSSYPIPSN